MNRDFKALLAAAADPDSDHSMGRDDGKICEYDWVISLRSNTLHAPRLDAPITNPWNNPIYRVACGRVMSVMIPGLGDRAILPRCTQCCRNRGYPPGVGSPKNDAACRELLGLPPVAGATRPQWRK